VIGKRAMANSGPSNPDKPATGSREQSASRRWIVIIVAAMLTTVGFSLYTNLSREAAKAQVRQQTLQALQIATAGGTRNFMVEIAKTIDERSRGLMFRQHMPEDRGMLFDFERSEPVAMWMRNTYIALDMLFIRDNGVIHHIHERAEPLNETTIESRGPVRFVLELNGGIAAKLGIKAGDRVIHPLIGR
jgi:uncharacterized protein